MNILNITNNKINNNNISNIYIDDYSKIKDINKEEKSTLIYIEENSQLDLLVNYNDNDQENLIIYIANNCDIKLTKLRQGLTLIGKIKYIINDNSKLLINEICNINNVDEKIDIELNGINSSVEYYFSTISSDAKKYKLNIYHNNINTKSNIYSRGVSLNKSNLEFDISGFVKKGSSNSYLNQDSKIMMLQDNKSIIKPNLYIDEDKVEAKHASVVGKFSDEELFYLRSRGLDYNTAINLLVKSFILGKLNIDDNTRYEVLKIINSHGGEKNEYKKRFSIIKK